MNDNGEECMWISTDLEGLDPYSKSYTFEPLGFHIDSAGEMDHEAFDPLEWGGFKIEFK